MTLCLSNYGDKCCKLYVLMFGLWLFSRFTPPLTQRASRGARRQLNLNPGRESTRRREKIAIFMESRMFDFGNNVNVALCLYGYCVPMSTHIEFVCCLEKAGLPDRADRCLHEL